MKEKKLRVLLGLTEFILRNRQLGNILQFYVNHQRKGQGLKLKLINMIRLLLFSHAKPFLLSTTSCRYHIFSPKFSLTESDTVGPQLLTWSKNSWNYHIKAPKFVLELNFPLSVKTLTSLCNAIFSLIKILLLIT